MNKLTLITFIQDKHRPNVQTPYILNVAPNSPNGYTAKDLRNLEKWKVYLSKNEGVSVEILID